MTTSDRATKWRAGDALPAEERVARNTSSVSENKIHEDDIARRYGFRGGLVPGATTYAYIASYLARTLGVDWATSGSSTVALVRPIYDGETIRIGGEVAAVEGDARSGVVSVSCWADGPGDVRCAPATARVARPPTTTNTDERPVFSRTEQSPRRPEERGPITASTAPVGVPLPPVHVAAAPPNLARYLDEIDEYDPLFRLGWDGGTPLVHPGWWPSLANKALSANFLLNAWIHTRSEIQHLRPALPGGVYHVYSQLVEAFEKRGHEYVTADVLITDGGDQPVARVAHTAIVVVGTQSPRS